MKRLFLLITAICCISANILSQEKLAEFRKPTLTEIEKSLFKFINKEREKINLKPLKYSMKLSIIANKHSKDMAEQKKLSHLFSDGKSYIDYLVKQDFYFIKTGENIAFSETFVPEIIHSTLMNSPEHRENILNKDFDMVGIGVFYLEKKGYYITQDFIQSLKPKPKEEARKIIIKVINQTRKEKFLPKIPFLKRANEFADLISEKRAKKEILPKIPYNFGETNIYFISTPVLSKESIVIKEIKNGRYEGGGVGIWFGRTKEYPGGTYLITLLLFPENKYKNLSHVELQKIILDTINKIRTKYGMNVVELDKGLSAEAYKDLINAYMKKGRGIIFPIPGKERNRIFFYYTPAPNILSPRIRSQIMNPSIQKIGVGVKFIKSSEFPSGSFWIAVILK